MEQDPQSLVSLAHTIPHMFARKSSTYVKNFARTDILPFAIPREQLAHRIIPAVAKTYGKEPFPNILSSCSNNNRRFPSLTMAALAVESRTLVTEDQLLQQKISDHLEKIATAMKRMADAMEESTIFDGMTHPQIREPPPSYAVSTHLVLDSGRPYLQTPVHDRIDAIERDKRTLQIAFGIAMTGIAICYICSEGEPIPLSVLFGMLLALVVGCTVSRRN